MTSRLARFSPGQEGCLGTLILVTLALVGHTAGAMICWMGQEPDPSMSGRLRWMIPEPDPCKCTKVHLGPLNTKAPCRPFKVTYYDSFFQSDDQQEIRRLLNCSDACVSGPCMNGGICMADRHALDYKCRCPSQFVGANCEHKNFCLEQMCLNGGRCTLTLSDPPFNCTCPPQFAGALCEIHVSHTCHSDPCLNGGNCTMTEDGYGFNCTCTPEFLGATCDIYNPCHAVHCSNGGTCFYIGHGVGYECKCSPGYIGALCENDDPCVSSPCSDKGNCTVSRDASEYKCACHEGYVGINCEHDDECLKETQPCTGTSHKNVCRPNVHGSHTCECPEGQTGENCDETLDPCSSMPCQNNGNCTTASSMDSFTCTCGRYFSGKYCQNYVSCRAYAQARQNHYNGWYDISTKCGGERPTEVLCHQTGFDGGWMKLYMTSDDRCSKGLRYNSWLSSLIACPVHSMPITGFALSSGYGVELLQSGSWFLDEEECSALTVNISMITALANCRRPYTSELLSDQNNKLLSGNCTITDDRCTLDSGGYAQVRVYVQFRKNTGLWIFETFDYGTFCLRCRGNSGWITVQEWGPSHTRSMWIKN